MKLCYSEVMKLLKELDEKKSELLRRERNRRIVNYKKGESKPNSKYSYKQTREDVDKIDAKTRKLRLMMGIANGKTLIDGFDITISEALVYLAQLQNKLTALNDLATQEQLTEREGYDGTTRIYECVFDVEEACADLENVRVTINKLQVAIDRANLTNFLEIE